MCDVQQGCRGLGRLQQTVEQPLSQGQTGRRGTGSSTRPEDGGGRVNERVAAWLRECDDLFFENYERLY